MVVTRKFVRGRGRGLGRGMRRIPRVTECFSCIYALFIQLSIQALEIKTGADWRWSWKPSQNTTPHRNSLLYNYNPKIEPNGRTTPVGSTAASCASSTPGAATTTGRCRPIRGLPRRPCAGVGDSTRPHKQVQGSRLRVQVSPPRPEGVQAFDAPCALCLVPCTLYLEPGWADQFLETLSMANHVYVGVYLDWR